MNQKIQHPIYASEANSEDLGTVPKKEILQYHGNWARN